MKLVSKGFASLPIIIIIVLILGGGAYFLVSKGIIKNPLPNFSNLNLGSQIFKKVQNSSGQKTLETNPFAKINPFKGVYKNPFE